MNLDRAIQLVIVILLAVLSLLATVALGRLNDVTIIEIEEPPPRTAPNLDV